MIDLKDAELYENVRKASKCSELYERVATFDGYRDQPNGGAAKITITVLHDRDAKRFVIHAENEAGDIATGNPESSIALALHTTHWSNLDSHSADR